MLVVVADRRIMGEIRRSRQGRLAFVYDDRWRSSDGAYPLSLSMPLAVAEHGHARIEPWLQGLLPDNDTVLSSWGRRFHVSPRNAFALLGAVGEDCAGSVQLLRPDRVAAVLEDEGQRIDWLTEGEVAERLRILKNDQGAWWISDDAGRFSLAGAQAKTALLFDGRRWGVPSGRTPTTHILKPPIEAGHVENEHVCLALASALGLPAAGSEIRRFEDETAIVVKRYDRLPNSGGIRRLHQEDMCQALGLPPTSKYQSDGGPGCKEICEAIWTHSGAPEADVRTFARAQILNWIVGSTDGHAKNFSLLIGAGGRARLAPLYDVASALPYDFQLQKLKMAFRIGGKYRIEEIHSRQWSRFADEASLPAAEVLELGRSMAASLPEILRTIVDRTRAAGRDHPILKRMVDALSSRAERCARVLATTYVP